MPQPRVKLKCPANIHTGPSERIIEFTFPGTRGDVYAQGGLIQFKEWEGIGHVNVYGCDLDVVVNGIRTGDGDPVSAERSDGKVWDQRWPEEEGWFWFYGDPYSADIEQKHVRQYAVHISKISNGFMHVCEGNFMYQAQSSPGFWAPMETPEDPTEDSAK